MKLLILILILILIFALCYIMYQETTTSTWKNQYENLQNMDASYLYHDQRHADAFNKKIMNQSDPDLSGIFQPGTYNSTYFRDNSDNVYDISGIEKDIKYFNNVSHILADYYSKNMIVDEVSE